MVQSRQKYIVEMKAISWERKSILLSRYFCTETMQSFETADEAPPVTLFTPGQLTILI